MNSGTRMENFPIETKHVDKRKERTLVGSLNDSYQVQTWLDCLMKMMKGRAFFFRFISKDNIGITMNLRLVFFFDYI